MNIIKVGPGPRVRGVHAPNLSHLGRDFNSGACSSRVAFDPLYVTSLCLRPKSLSRSQCQPVLISRQPLHICLAGGQGMMENNGDFQNKSLQEAIEQFKGQSIEDILRQQMQKGGSGDVPPGGRRGGGGGDGDSSGGSDGMSNENLQVVLATVCFVIMYIFVINGLELIKLARDCVKFASGRGQSARLKRAMYRWVKLYKNIVEKKEAAKNGLEKACTCWFDPDFFRGLSRHNLKSTHE
ncbi:uncharacterized protein LOC106775224 isoform X1 [Vigna radiata var. radiata]|uniref:Uncharacterized protein LOC106775224 isoform X1 n=1 Tax=Vigna radiata var. radiata TaxID=3916 RepID=A0A1S3VHF9_VIGRR|nr:uncharacterized protein LOC106775224 isoform X1 [Vigna radiata var. radiata]XP_014517799.1 uncharacterized protein LOC106775224 isoform X1 [Vigna radiata var. radiata]